MVECIYSLKDASNKIFDCKVLDQLGKLLRIEDQPKFFEYCPLRLNSIRFHYAPPEKFLDKKNA
jgi:hypothetical protein